MCRNLLLLVLGLIVSLSVPVTADLVGWWTLDDGAGTVAADSSGNGLDGTLEGDPQWVSGVLDGALELDGDDYVDTGYTENLTEWTIAIWCMSPDAPDADPPSGPLHREQNYQINWDHPTGSWQGSAALNAGGWNNAPFGTLEADTWYHLAATYDGTTLTTYQDGVEIASATIPGPPSNETNSLKLGRHAANGAQFFTGTVDDARVYNEALTLEEIQKVMRGGANPALSSNPFPEDNQDDVIRSVVLSWNAGDFAVAHDVYFGTTFEDVNDASRTNPGDILLSQDQAETSYPLGRLELGQTYFWRIDEVNAAPDGSIHKGQTWSFTVEPVSYPVASTNITATASSTNRSTTGPERTIDGSGLDENDGHSTNADHMWLSASPDADPWIQYEFDTVYKLDRMLLWNGNQTAESAVGWGLKNVQIETSGDGESWNVLADITQLAQAPGEEGAGPSDDINLGGIAAKYVRISITSNYGGLLPQYNLSEIRFYYFPVQAREPEPASGTTDVRPDAVLSWRAGREADTHTVLVSADANAVLDGSAPSQTVTDNRFDLASLDLPIGESYFWKVNEVNDAEDPSTWEGPVWDFNIPDPLVVDDFESYDNDAPSRPYVTWRDGLPYANPAPGDEGNGTGAIVGHDIFSPGSPYFDGDLMEMGLIHGGTQSLPLYYDNSGNGGNEPYSEMTRTFSPAQDWSGNAIATLTLYFRGVEGNTGQLYVKINDTKLSYTDDPGAIGRPLWEQWNIDLASSGANLLNVQSLTVGIENAGSGLVYVDDIVLYRDAPAPAPQGTDPGNAGLVASYSMESNLNDATGNYNGTATGTPGYEAGVSGMALSFDGVEDYVDLPIGSVIASAVDMTIACWVDVTDNTVDWQRIFDFGTGETANMFLTSNNGATNVLRFAITMSGNTGESLVDGLTSLPTGWHHVAVTIDSSTMTISLYLDGSIVDSDSTETLPQDLGETTQNWLGRSQYTADPFFEGSLDDFLIYDRALSEAEIRYLAGEQ